MGNLPVPEDLEKLQQHHPVPRGQPRTLAEADLRASQATLLGWSRMSGRRTSGSSRPSLGVQVLAVSSFIS